LTVAFIDTLFVFFSASHVLTPIISPSKAGFHGMPFPTDLIGEIASHSELPELISLSVLARDPRSVVLPRMCKELRLHPHSRPAKYYIKILKCELFANAVVKLTLVFVHMTPAMVKLLEALPYLKVLHLDSCDFPDDTPRFSGANVETVHLYTSYPTTHSRIQRIRWVLQSCPFLLTFHLGHRPYRVQPLRQLTHRQFRQGSGLKVLSLELSGGFLQKVLPVLLEFKMWHTVKELILDDDAGHPEIYQDLFPALPSLKHLTLCVDREFYLLCSSVIYSCKADIYHLNFAIPSIQSLTIVVGAYHLHEAYTTLRSLNRADNLKNLTIDVRITKEDTIDDEPDIWLYLDRAIRDGFINLVHVTFILRKHRDWSSDIGSFGPWYTTELLSGDDFNQVAKYIRYHMPDVDSKRILSFYSP
jgi:hypothetical protein